MPRGDLRSISGVHLQPAAEVKDAHQRLCPGWVERAEHAWVCPVSTDAERPQLSDIEEESEAGSHSGGSPSSSWRAPHKQPQQPQHKGWHARRKGDETEQQQLLQAVELSDAAAGSVRNSNGGVEPGENGGGGGTSVSSDPVSQQAQHEEG